MFSTVQPFPCLPISVNCKLNKASLSHHKGKHGLDGAPAMMRELDILCSHPSASFLYTVNLAGMKFKTEEEAVLLSLTDGSFHNWKEAGKAGMWS